MQETTETHLIRDRTGRVLEVAVEGCGLSLQFRVLDRNALAAHASCLDQGGVLLLGDIVVESAAFIFEPPLLRFYRRLLRRPLPTADYRRRGIGSVLLNLVIATARRRGASRIEGMVVAKDVAENTALLGWYKRHGFAVTLDPDPQGPRVATVSCQLG